MGSSLVMKIATLGLGRYTLDKKRSVANYLAACIFELPQCFCFVIHKIRHIRNGGFLMGALAFVKTAITQKEDAHGRIVSLVRRMQL